MNNSQNPWPNRKLRTIISSLALRFHAACAARSIDRLKTVLEPGTQVSRRTIQRRAREVFLATQTLLDCMTRTYNDRANWLDELSVLELTLKRMLAVPYMEDGLRFNRWRDAVPRNARRSVRRLDAWHQKLDRKVGVFTTKNR